VSARVLHTATVLALAVLLVGCGGQASSADPDSLLNEGWRAYAMGDFAPAKARFERVAQDSKATDDQMYSAVLGLAVTAHYSPKPDLEGALKNYKRLSELNAPAAAPQGMLGVGMVYLTQGKTQEGQMVLTDLVKQFPDSYEANEAAVQVADSLFRPTPDKNAVGGYRLANAASIQRGMALLERRLKAYPDNALAVVMHMMLASQLIETESYAGAVAYLRAALDFGIESSRTRSSVTWQIARIAEQKLQDYALAEKYYSNYVDGSKRSQLYYRALLSRDRMQKLLAEQTKE